MKKRYALHIMPEYTDRVEGIYASYETACYQARNLATLLPSMFWWIEMLKETV